MDQARESDSLPSDDVGRYIQYFCHLEAAYTLRLLQQLCFEIHLQYGVTGLIINNVKYSKLTWAVQKCPSIYA